MHRKQNIHTHSNVDVNSLTHSNQWWLLVCGAGGDAGCDAGLVGAPGVPFFSALPDAYSALCLVLYCAAPLDVCKSLEWHSSTITKIFPSTLRNALVAVTKHNATTPDQSTTPMLLCNT